MCIPAYQSLDCCARKQYTSGGQLRLVDKEGEREPRTLQLRTRQPPGHPAQHSHMKYIRQGQRRETAKGLCQKHLLCRPVSTFFWMTASAKGRREKSRARRSRTGVSTHSDCIHLSQICGERRVGGQRESRVAGRVRGRTREICIVSKSGCPFGVVRENLR